MFKRTKYGNKKVIIDGITFDSIGESKRYLFLKDLEKQGLISNLLLQPVFLLQENYIDKNNDKHRKLEYIADFQYKDEVVDEIIVEDYKGMITEVFKIKLKLLLYKYPELNFILIK